jgi:hypothetical protein
VLEGSTLVNTLTKDDHEGIHQYLIQWGQGTQTALNMAPNHYPFTVKLVDPACYRTMHLDGYPTQFSIECFAMHVYNAMACILGFRLCGTRHLPAINFYGCAGQFEFLIKSDSTAQYGNFRHVMAVNPSEQHSHQGWPLRSPTAYPWAGNCDARYDVFRLDTPAARLVAYNFSLRQLRSVFVSFSFKLKFVK